MSDMLGNNDVCQRGRQDQIILKFSLFIAAFVMLLALGAGSAWSAEYNEKTNNSKLQILSSSIADDCNPLLKSIRHSYASHAMEDNQRNAGKAAALALMLGVRFALEQASEQQKQPDGLANHAMLVSEYRRCVKENALGVSDGHMQADIRG